MVEYSGNVTSVRVSRSNSPSDSDQDEVSTVQEFNDYCGAQAFDLPALDVSNLATTVVKMENSSNVEIKPVTQVTVHQYFRDADPPGPGGRIPTISKYCNQSGTGEAELSAGSKPHNTPEKKFFYAIASAIPWKLRVLLGVVVTIIIIVVIIVSLIVFKKDDTLDTHIRTNLTGPEGTSYDLGNDIHIITRDRWGGRPILDGYQNRTLVHPIKLVIIGHTVSTRCMTIESCSSKLQSIQSDHVGNNDWLDIGYNFLVGGDGNIYKALGWDIRNYVRNNSIAIQFIGNYVYEEVLDRQRMGLKALLEHGVKLGKLDKDYFLVGQCQVTATQSPGKHLLAEIKKWSHYYNQTFT